MRKQIKDYLLSLNAYTYFYQLALGYSNNYLEEERDTFFHSKPLDKIKEILFKKNAIMVFVIRCNERISFNDIERNNDLLVIAEYISEDNFNVYTFNVTADPKSQNPNIAHLIEQIYTGNIRPHRWIAGRQAICSDKGCWYRRTDKKGSAYDPKFGQIGINIHDTGGYFNSSLGCVILESDSEYKNVFKPLLKRCSNPNNIPCLIVNEDYFKDILKVI